ncbi:oligosaccharide flippase family protein [Pedobacter sp. HMF7647]|uniref:Oligosaccharide flippase family protein n=1 Tax=Hufsiella arboris TaxID=2695275 RepID=A0A7K1YCE6_9SPHI|nr:flippase [Hufsiella arboris]MXV51718.1 oligosaccharide flippase family protein [Hufsiella arboris]
MRKNYIYNLLLSVSNILFPILSFPYASHILGPEGIGKVQFVISFAMYFGMLAALGIPLYGIAKTATSRDDKGRLSVVFSELLSLYFIACLVLSVAYLLLIYFVPFFRADLQIYLAGGIVLYLGFTTIDWFYSGIEEFRLISIRSVFIKMISLVLLFLFVRQSSDYYNYLYILVFSMVGNNLISLLLAGRHVKFTLSGLNLKQHLKPLLYILGTGLAASIYTILDTVLLGFLANERSVGLYTAAVKLTKISIPLIVSFGTILIPQISAAFSKNDRLKVNDKLAESFDFLALIAVPVATGLFLLAPEFIEVFSGAAFRDAILPMQILAIVPFLVGLGHLLSFQMLVPFGLGRQMFFASLGGVLCCLLLNVILVPTLKEVGGAIANISSEVVVNVLYYLYLKKHFNFSFKTSLLFKAFCSSLIFIPIIILIKHFTGNEIIILLISILLCVVSYFSLQLIVFKDELLVKTYRSLLSKAGLVRSSS